MNINAPNANKTALHPQLAEIVRKLDEASTEACRIAGNLDANELKRHPHSGGWSIAECLVPLNLSNEAEIEVLNQAFEGNAGEKRPNEAACKIDWLGRFLKWTLEPPMFWSKMKTIREFQPTGDEAAEQALPRFLDLQEQIKKRVESANGLPLDRIKVVSPFNRKIRYNLLSFFHILPAHERRHLWQARQALKRQS